MKIKNDLKKYGPHIIVGSFLLILIILFGIYDLTIALSFNTYINWFSIGFDMWGMQAVMIPIGITIMFISIIITNKIYKNNNHILKGSIIGLIISITLILIYEGIRFDEYFSSSKLEKDKIEFISSIIIFLVSLSSLIGGTLLVNKVDAFKDDEYLNSLLIRVVLAITLLAITTLVVTVAKEIWGRPRPNAVIKNQDLFKYIFEFNFGDNRGKSFPSGHTQASGMFLVIAYFVPKINKRNIWVNSIIIFSFVSMVLTGISRIVYHKHFPTDVTFAILLVFAFYIFVTPVVNSIIKK